MAEADGQQMCAVEALGELLADIERRKASVLKDTRADAFVHLHELALATNACLERVKGAAGDRADRRSTLKVMQGGRDDNEHNGGPAAA